MTPEEIVELFRLDVDDTDADDPLWTELEVYTYLDEAQKRFARKTDYFSDMTTADICQVAITADDPWVTLDPRVTKIRTAQLLSTGSKVTPMTFAEMEDQPNTADTYGSPLNFSQTYRWQKSTGIPRFIITDMERNKGRLAGIPVDSDTLIMQVYRLPLKDLKEGAARFEIDESDYQRALLPYMKHLAYSKNDVDTFEQDLADRWRLQAAETFGEIRRDLRRRRYSAHTGTTKYGGY